jgi:hypothetical protein
MPSAAGGAHATYRWFIGSATDGSDHSLSLSLRLSIFPPPPPPLTAQLSPPISHVHRGGAGGRSRPRARRRCSRPRVHHHLPR